MGAVRSPLLAVVARERVVPDAMGPPSWCERAAAGPVSQGRWDGVRGAHRRAVGTWVPLDSADVSANIDAPRCPADGAPE
jgi:hypothetical protein